MSTKNKPVISFRNETVTTSEIFEKYGKKTIPAGRYETIKVNADAEPTPNVVYMPFITSTERSNEREFAYDKFMYEYDNLHKCCPKCGDEQHSSTLMGYILNMDKPEEYKDLNCCTCMKCGDIHTTHQRVSKS